MVIKFDKKYTDKFAEILDNIKIEDSIPKYHKTGQSDTLNTLDSSPFDMQNNGNLNIDKAVLLYHPFELMIHAAQGKFFQHLKHSDSEEVAKGFLIETIAAAIYLGNTEYIQLLHQYGLYDFKDSHSFHKFKSSSLIDAAVETNNYEMVKALLDAGAKPDMHDDRTIDINTSDEIAELLIAHGAKSINEKKPFLQDFLLPKISISLEKIENKFNFHNIRDNCLPKKEQIPHKIHYIWLTDPEHPTEAPESNLNITRSTVETIKKQTNYDDWEFIYHSNALSEAYNTTKFFSDLGFKLVDLNSEYNQFETGSSLTNLFIDSKKWGMAADLARYEIINHQGGIYYDLNFNGTRALDHEVCAYDHFNFANELTSDSSMVESIENYFFASVKNHPILQNLIADYKNIFFGDSAVREYFVSTLNDTIKTETDDLYALFPVNSRAYMSDKSIVFKFKKFYEESDVCEAHSSIEDLLFPKDLITDIRNSQPPIDQCTSNEVLPFGEDSYIDGRSW